MSRKWLVGPIPLLRGKTALVRPSVSVADQVIAQFDEGYLREA
jgi:hypothetical protein